MWKRDLEEAIVDAEDASKKILGMALPHGPLVDRLVWHFTSHGGYTVKSGYDVAL